MRVFGCEGYRHALLFTPPLTHIVELYRVDSELEERVYQSKFKYEMQLD